MDKEQRENWKRWNDQTGEVTTTPWAELMAEIVEPTKEYHLVCIEAWTAVNAEGEWQKLGEVEYSENSLPPLKKIRKPKLTRCPHCGKGLYSLPTENLPCKKGETEIEAELEIAL